MSNTDVIVVKIESDNCNWRILEISEDTEKEIVEENVRYNT